MLKKYEILLLEYEDDQNLILDIKNENSQLLTMIDTLKEEVELKRKTSDFEGKNLRTSFAALNLGRSSFIGGFSGGEFNNIFCERVSVMDKFTKNSFLGAGLERIEEGGRESEERTAKTNKSVKIFIFNMLLILLLSGKFLYIFVF